MSSLAYFETSLKDHPFNLMVVQAGSGAGQGWDNQALKGVRIPGLLNFLDLFYRRISRRCRRGE
jgi:hypothetical protein